MQVSAEYGVISNNTISGEVNVAIETVFLTPTGATADIPNKVRLISNNTV